MGFFGNIGRFFRPDAASSPAAAPTASAAAPAPGDPRRRLFGDGSIGGIADGVGKILAYGPFTGMVQGSINRRLDTRTADAQRRQALSTQNAPTPVALGGMNGQRGSGSSASVPFGPRASSFPPAGSLPPDAIDHLRQNPTLALHFDAKYGPGSAARVLNQAR